MTDLDAPDSPDVEADLFQGGIENPMPDRARLSPKRERPWLWRVALVGLTAWTVAALATGIAIGTRKRPEPVAAQPDIEVAIESVSIPDAPASGTDDSSAVIVPNVLGLSPTEAQAALTDAGSADGVELVEREVAGPAGIVISQDPSPGKPFVGAVVLSVSAEVQIPDVVGQPFQEIRKQLEAFGTFVRIRTEYQSGSPRDLVLSIDPPSGPLPTEVELVVAAPPAELDLNQLDPVERDCGRSQDFGVNGKAPSEPAWICELARTTFTRSVSWNLSAAVSSVSLTAGITDQSDPSATGRVDVLLDGKVVESQPTSFGSPVVFDIPTVGALRLELLTTTDAADEVYNELARSSIGIIEIIALGGAEALDELAGLNS